MKQLFIDLVSWILLIGILLLCGLAIAAGIWWTLRYLGIT